jgi:hypothetical protein
MEMNEGIDGLSLSIAVPRSSGGPTERDSQKSRRRWVVTVLASLTVLLAAIVTVGWWRYHVRPISRAAKSVIPVLRYVNGRVVLESPTGILVGKVGAYPDELTAYLRFDYLKGLQTIGGANLFIVTQEESAGPVYDIYLELPNDILTAYHTLAEMMIAGHIRGFELESPLAWQIQHWETETTLFNVAYQQPVRQRLLHLPRNALTSAVASFILFKVRTDRRVRERLEPAAGKELSIDDAKTFAADMIAVAEFYEIPLDMLLGIGAMENNYLDIRGDLKHAVWKKHAQKGDIILRRRRGRVLVSNYSIGPWQITRETLRYAHSLCLRDKRDYGKLPARLRPPQQLDLEHIDSHILTTYAGLLLRNLLDYFHGDVQKAQGAYNGGRLKPNSDYSSGVATVASYARRVVGLAAGRKGNAVSETSLVVANKADPPQSASAE